AEALDPEHVAVGVEDPLERVGDRGQAFRLHAAEPARQEARAREGEAELLRGRRVALLERSADPIEVARAVEIERGLAAVEERERVRRRGREPEQLVERLDRGG